MLAIAHNSILNHTGVYNTSKEARLWQASLLQCAGTGASATVVGRQCLCKCIIHEFYLIQWPTL